MLGVYYLSIGHNCSETCGSLVFFFVSLFLFYGSGPIQKRLIFLEYI